MADGATAFREPAYFVPGSIDEALVLLDEYGPAARLLAGGQTLITEIDAAEAAIGAVIDLRCVTSLAQIRWADDHVDVGAMVTIAAARRALAPVFPVIDRCFGHVGNYAVRNRATLGGSIALADPASEVSAFLLAYGASASFAGKEGTKPVGELLTGSDHPSGFIRSFRIPLPATGERAGFAEILRRRSGGRSLAMALVRSWAGGARLVVSGGAVQPTPFEGADIEALVAAFHAAGLAAGTPAVAAWMDAALRRAIAETEAGSC